MKDLFKPNPKHRICIGGIEYCTTAFLSVRDMEYIAGLDFIAGGLNYREITLSILRTHLIDYPYQIIRDDLIDDLEIERFIDAYIENSKELKMVYLGERADDQFERFIRVLKKRVEDLGKKIAENLRPALQNYVDSVKITIPPMSKLVITPQFQASLNAITEISKAYQASMVSLAKTLLESINRMLPDYSYAMNSLSQAISKYTEAFRSSLLSDERKKELQDAFRQWGEYGWTLPPNANLDLFFCGPTDEKTAFKIIQPYLDSDGMQFIFDKLLGMKHIRKSDLKEAIANYEDKRYKSCIMLLFSIIDARIIRLQDVNKEKRRPSGYKGANKFFEKVEADGMVDMTFADVLYKYSILASLSVVFESGNDFRRQPNVINRNFIDHGMLHRNVIQRDCKKVFLLLYNFESMVEDLAIYE